MNAATLTAIANVVGAPAFAVLVCLSLVGFGLYKILPRLQEGRDATDAIRKDRERKQKEYSERFDRIERSVIEERSARETFEALTMQRLKEGNDKFEKLDSKVDDLRNSVGKVDNGVAKLSGQIDMLIKMKEV
mgnify:FL=1